MIDDAVAEEMSKMTLFTSQVSWKMFIPPLPAHQVISFVRVFFISYIF